MVDIFVQVWTKSKIPLEGVSVLFLNEERE
jgi:hypothetical protein